MDQTREIILQLLGAIGSRKEVEQYLRQFSSVDQQRFAVIKVGGALLRDQLDELASSLTFLHRVGLTPIVVHGAGPQLNQALADEGIETRRINGMRVTDRETLVVVRKVMQRINLELVDKLEALGTRARPVTSGVFEAELMDSDTYGLVGEVKQIHLETLRTCVRGGYLPILTCLGETVGGQIVNINADIAARELALSIEPHKIVFLTGTGGLLDEKGRIISSINLSEDYDHLMGQEWVNAGMRVKLQQIKELLDQLPLSSSVSMSNAADLPRELFTHRGAGTFIQRGERVEELMDFTGVDREKLRGLLEECFGKTLVPDYFDTKEVERIFLTDSFRATAVITKEVGMPYLDKFAVTPKAQGEGLGASIWARMREAFPQLFWRSRADNPINTWYFQQADGAIRGEDWTVFWYGFEETDRIEQCVVHARSLKASMVATG